LHPCHLERMLRSWRRRCLIFMRSIFGKCILRRVATRSQIGQYVYVHVVDGGLQHHGTRNTAFLRTSYNAGAIDHVVVTHPDQDHAEGLAPILEQFNIGALWMLKPWDYAPHFARRFSVQRDRAADGRP
jgi:beta-lactamase superfamily II metal-dependent hydrolase